MTMKELSTNVPRFVRELDGYRARIEGIWGLFTDLEQAEFGSQPTQLRKLLEAMDDGANAAEELCVWSGECVHTWPWMKEKGWLDEYRSLLLRLASLFREVRNPLDHEAELLSANGEFCNSSSVLERLFFRGLTVELEKTQL
jgi:hypothetical protein